MISQCDLGGFDGSCSMGWSLSCKFEGVTYIYQPIGENMIGSHFSSWTLASNGLKYF
jgi:hypothetical protein